MEISNNYFVTTEQPCPTCGRCPTCGWYKWPQITWTTTTAKEPSIDSSFDEAKWRELVEKLKGWLETDGK